MHIPKSWFYHSPGVEIKIHELPDILFCCIVTTVAIARKNSIAQSRTDIISISGRTFGSTFLSVYIMMTWSMLAIIMYLIIV